MSRRHAPGAMPEGHDAIRVHVDADEPPALAFNPRARPGALVSWAWCQLTALDALLHALAERRGAGPTDADVAAAVRAVLVPTINALAFSERRADDLRRERAARRARGAGKGSARRKARH